MEVYKYDSKENARSVEVVAANNLHFVDCKAVRVDRHMLPKSWR